MRKDLILKQPIITEKTLTLAQDGKFTFEVNSSANKHIIKNIVEELFKVNVIDIKTASIKGKTRRFGKKRQSKQYTDSKKAIVTLKKNQKIDLFDVVEEK